MSGALRWTLLALLGLLISAAVAFLATRIVSERIGISSEPVSAGEALSPAVSRTIEEGERREHRTTAASPSPAAGEPAPSAPGGQDRESVAGEEAGKDD